MIVERRSLIVRYSYSYEPWQTAKLSHFMVKCSGSSIMVWGYFSAVGASNKVIVCGKTDGAKWRPIIEGKPATGTLVEVHITVTIEWCKAKCNRMNLRDCTCTFSPVSKSWTLLLYLESGINIFSWIFCNVYRLSCHFGFLKPNLDPVFVYHDSILWSVCS